MSWPAALSNVVATEVLGLAGGGQGLAALINNLETGVGITGSAVTTTINYLLTNAASINPGHLHSSAGLSGTTGSGNIVLATSPTLVTPTLGVATATSINSLTITTSTGTLTITNAKTLSISNSLTLAGTDGTMLTFQGTDTYIGRGTTDTLTNKTLTSPTVNTPITNQGTTTMSAQAVDGTQQSGVYKRTLAASETFTQSGFATGRVFIVRVAQGSGTTYTVTWWSGITWITTNSAAPVQTTTSNGVTVYGFIVTGTNTFDGFLISTQ